MSRVEVAAEYFKNAGLPCPRRLIAAVLPAPYRGWGATWRIWSGDIGAWRTVDVPVSGHPDLDVLARTRPEAYARVFDAALGGVLGRLPIHTRACPGMTTALDGQTLCPMLQPLAEDVAGYTARALSWFWLRYGPEALEPFPVEAVEGITDEQVRRVMAAMQREIDRETNKMSAPQFREHEPLLLADLPFWVQRWLAEARRLCYLRYGITVEVWRRGWWSFWEVPCYGQEECDADGEV